ncbi:cobyrinate a,c-diamide synthase [Tessaracoccus caeni]|uniref:cobyrinate a,c-diamide synthase n=1 Tax=Tessaracoccus caeni TaxID=3031239 RepID=UPI0023DBBF09|nr:cobyrinate a,c-diamide synthase [Tessaracoccus caeni]MDF1488979.1 cobyrinate a,c-diamide synthase [Tessaracoccus caeni]
MVSVPRIVVAAPASGHGKTTVATGLMAALTARGVGVAPFKVGPDYIDPGYHTLAAGRPGRNLDPFLCGEELMGPLFAHGAAGMDIAVVEGVMGLFDGRLGTEGFASTAHVARLLDAPVLLVVDVRHTSRSVGALVKGMATFDPDVRIGGVVLNQVGSPRHEAEARAAVESVGIPVLGSMPRNLEIEAPSRHLGLVPVAERDDAGIVAMGAVVAAHLDIDAVVRLARTAPPFEAEPWDPASVVCAPSQARPVIAVAGGRAFTFRYPETDELLRAAGCEPVVFDPTTDAALPERTAGLWLGGGFPEVHAPDLAGNEALREQIRGAIADGMPTVAECAGLLYLCRELDGQPMVGALPGTSAMTKRLTMGYREAVAPAASLLGRPGETITGHEFHRTAADPGEPAAWLLDGRPDGVATDTLHASYLHVHWAGHPQLAQRFTDAVHAYDAHAASPDQVRPNPGKSANGRFSAQDSAKSAIGRFSGNDAAGEERGDSERAGGVATVEPDLLHHGDKDLGEGLIDFAVNLRQAEPPAWLRERLVRDTDWASYPDATPARRAIAAHHGVSEDMVLPLAGAAEGFTLIARAIPGTAAIVHPQFTEPEAALRAAGRHVERLILSADNGFRLPAALRDDARDVRSFDLVVVGNPTNPTGVLHRRDDLLRLLAKPGSTGSRRSERPQTGAMAIRIREGIPGRLLSGDGEASAPGWGRVVGGDRWIQARTLVVDEAFLDAIPGEPETLIAPEMPGRIVLRSLTKTWALAGVRAGYAVGDPAPIAALAAQQPPWSVSAPAIVATLACLTDDAKAEANRLAREAKANRADLVARLEAIGLPTIKGEAPFVLVDTSGTSMSSLREPLARLGFAVRRGETFPGLGPTWLRLAVRTPDVHRRLAEAIGTLEKEN